MNPDYPNISLQPYHYELPASRIALHPLPQRDASKLLIYKNNKISHDIFKNLSHHLPGPSLMVFNNTRVVQARLLFRKPTGAAIEVFCLEPLGENKDIQLAFQQKEEGRWFCLVGNAKKWKEDPLEIHLDNHTTLTARKGARIKDGYEVTFRWNGADSFAEILDKAGKTPLPPYISREAEEKDKTRYQTIFAQHKGSVAAPTAGLHFTPEVLQSLKNKSVEKAHLTLHVGAGTFKPVSTPTIAGHLMHHEQIVVDQQTIESLKKHAEGTIISVGTTSLRTLETLYWLGVKIMNGYTFGAEGFLMEQWFPYDNTLSKLPSAIQSMEAILQFMETRGMRTLHGETSLIIVPGYSVKMAGVLITNFHQPGSTLLLLVAAFCGDGWKDIYHYALDNDFRFLSYGDSCLLFKNTEAAST